MKSLIIDILNMVLSSLDSRPYLLEMRKVLSGLVSEDEDVIKTIKFLNIIIDKDITSRKEVLAELDDLFDSNITSKINPKGSKFSPKYREDFLKNINAEKFSTLVNKYISDMSETLVEMRSTNKEKVRSRLMDSIYNTSKELQEQLTSMKVSSGGSQSFIIDPNNTKMSIENLTPIINKSKESKQQSIKTFEGFDIVVHGGLKLGTTTLIVAKPSGFKSGLLQNLAIYATMNNSPDTFTMVPPGKTPAVFFVSLENTQRQLYERHVSFFHNSMQEVEAIIKGKSNEEIAAYIMQLSQENGTQLPIIYIDRVGHETNMSDIASDIAEYEQLGYHPVMLGIDYLSKMTTIDPTYRRYSDSSQEGAKKQAKKSEEIRSYCIERNVAGVIPEQLSTDAIRELEALRVECRRVDPLYHCTMDMINGARDLSREYENVIFIYKSEVANLEKCSDTTVISEYISLINKKVREEKMEYKLSNRDKLNGPLADLQTKKLKAGPLRDKLKETAELHVVMPLNNYRISDTDYAKSIRCFYVNDNTDAVSLSNLIEESNKIITDTDVFSEEPSNREKTLQELGL